MKTYTVAALFAAASVCAVAPATAATVEEYLGVMDEMLGAVNEMSQTLSAVTDKASADAAAPKVLDFIKKIEAAKAKAEALGEASPEMQAEMLKVRPDLEQQMTGALMGLLGAMETAVGDDENPCHGSEALLNALQSMSEQ